MRPPPLVQMANDVVAHEGSLGREMFFLVNGNVDVTAMVWEGMDLRPGSNKFKRVESLVCHARGDVCEAGGGGEHGMHRGPSAGTYIELKEV